MRDQIRFHKENRKFSGRNIEYKIVKRNQIMALNLKYLFKLFVAYYGLVRPFVNFYRIFMVFYSSFVAFLSSCIVFHGLAWPFHGMESSSKNVRGNKNVRRNKKCSCEQKMFVGIKKYS